MPQFKQMPCDPKQMWLVAPSLDEMVGLDSDVRALSEAMDRLDWSAMEGTYSETGCPAYPPCVMTKLLVYAYSKGVRSSRKIEELVEHDVRYMWLGGQLKPDFRTIARFRKEKFNEVSELFADSVRLCKEAGLVSMQVVAIDGTKVAANAGKKSVYDAKRLEREREAVERVLREAEEVDASEDAQYGDSNGREIPEHLRDAQKRKEKLDEIAQRLSARKIVSTSDTECRMMKTTEGIRPGFNVQAAVDAERQVVVAANVIMEEHDHGQLTKMLDEVEENTGISACVALADSGYSDEQTLKELDERQQVALVAVREHPEEKKRSDLFASKCFLRDEERDVLVCPAGRELTYRQNVRAGSGTYRTYRATGCGSCSFRRECVRGKGHASRTIQVSVLHDQRQRMRERLASDAGKTVFRLRKTTVEPVFGQFKHNRGFRRFLLRGVNGASAEVHIALLAHNLLKYAAKRAILRLFLSLCNLAAGMHPSRRTPTARRDAFTWGVALS